MFNVKTFHSKELFNQFLIRLLSQQKIFSFSAVTKVAKRDKRVWEQVNFVIGYRRKISEEKRLWTMSKDQFESFADLIAFVNFSRCFLCEEKFKLRKPFLKDQIRFFLRKTWKIWICLDPNFFRKTDLANLFELKRIYLLFSSTDTLRGFSYKDTMKRYDKLWTYETNFKI